MSSRQRDPIAVTTQMAPPLPPSAEVPKKFSDNFKVLKLHHMKALIWKNFLWMWRNVGVMAFIVGLPVAQIIIFCLAIGHDPTGLRIAVTNNELTSDMISQQDCPVYSGCNYTYLSCRYLTYLKNNKSMVLEHYDTAEAAYEQVRRGWAWGSMIFTSNYSDALKERSEEGRFATDEALAASEIEVRLDMSGEDNFLKVLRIFFQSDIIYLKYV